MKKHANALVPIEYLAWIHPAFASLRHSSQASQNILWQIGQWMAHTSTLHFLKIFLANLAFNLFQSSISSISEESAMAAMAQLKCSSKKGSQVNVMSLTSTASVPGLSSLDKQLSFKELQIEKTRENEKAKRKRESKARQSQALQAEQQKQHWHFPRGHGWKVWLVLHVLHFLKASQNFFGGYCWWSDMLICCWFHSTSTRAACWIACKDSRCSMQVRHGWVLSGMCLVGKLNQIKGTI